MSDRCFTPEELAELSADDPRRAHVDGCPRCQAVMKSFVAFMDPADIPKAADLADAHARLSGALEREIGSGPKVVRPDSGFWTPFRARMIAAVAAVLVVAVGLSLFRAGPDGMAPGEPVLRGVGTPAAPFRCKVEKSEGVGGYQLTWAGIAEATDYRVVVYGADLEEIVGFDVESGTTFELNPPEGAAFCRVIALRDGDELERSAPAYFGEC